jgi:hypothetical protein
VTRKLSITFSCATSTAPNIWFTFSPVNATAQAERFTWKSANYGGAVEVVYTVEVDKNALKHL